MFLGSKRLRQVRHNPRLTRSTRGRGASERLSSLSPVDQGIEFGQLLTCGRQNRRRVAAPTEFDRPSAVKRKPATTPVHDSVAFVSVSNWLYGRAAENRPPLVGKRMGLELGHSALSRKSDGFVSCHTAE